MSDVRNFVRLFLPKFNSINIDNAVFRLHYKITVTIVLALSLLVLSKQCFGNPMDCYFPDLPGASLNTYCYIQSTFPVEKSTVDPVDTELPCPEVFGFRAGDKSKVFGYYEWVFIALLAQAICFYLPHYLWKTLEKGRMKMLTKDFVLEFANEKYVGEEDVEPLGEYFWRQLHRHNNYAYKYFICEALNCVNVLAQIHFMRYFIGEDFRYHDIYAVMFDQQPSGGTSTKLMEQVFPTISDCTYRKQSSTGDIMDFHGVCVLPQNFLNQKIYICLWFWCHILATISVLTVVYRTITVLSSKVRFHQFRVHGYMNTLTNIKLVYKELWIGDWFILMMLRSNISPLAYNKLIFRMSYQFIHGPVCAKE